MVCVDTHTYTHTNLYGVFRHTYLYTHKPICTHVPTHTRYFVCAQTNTPHTCFYTYLVFCKCTDKYPTHMSLQNTLKIECWRFNRRSQAFINQSQTQNLRDMTSLHVVYTNRICVCVNESRTHRMTCSR